MYMYAVVPSQWLQLIPRWLLISARSSHFCHCSVYNLYIISVSFGYTIYSPKWLQECLRLGNHCACRKQNNMIHRILHNKLFFRAKVIHITYVHVLDGMLVIYLIIVIIATVYETFRHDYHAYTHTHTHTFPQF